MKNKIIALIPARSGSERLKDKNIKDLNGKPLLYYSIKSALKSKIFDKIILSTDSTKYKSIAQKFGADVPFLRPKKFAKSNSPDFDWINFTLNKLKKNGTQFDLFFILRPTNPFRTHNTILRAWKKFKSNYKKFDCLRAVEPCKQHPYKMWIKKKDSIKPFFNKKKSKQPYYNMQMKSLPKIYIQNASLEISKVSNLKKYKTITGKKIMPFFTKDNEGFDINYKIDLLYAKKIFNNKKNINKS
jgi:CMP-N,N'-diacetyllegionaminic acid synthase